MKIDQHCQRQRCKQLNVYFSTLCSLRSFAIVYVKLKPKPFRDSILQCTLSNTFQFSTAEMHISRNVCLSVHTLCICLKLDRFGDYLFSAAVATCNVQHYFNLSTHLVSRHYACIGWLGKPTWLERHQCRLSFKQWFKWGCLRVSQTPLL